MLTKRLVFGLACLWASVAAAEEPTRIDLAAAKRFAAEHNQNIKSLRFAVDEMAARRERARSAFRPRAGIGAGVELDAEPPAAEAAPIGYLYGSYNIFNGYRDRNRERIAELEIETSA